MKQRLMDLYFTEGADLTDAEVLVAPRPTAASMPTTTRDRLASDRDVAAVEKAANSAKEAGIDGVPCFIFGGVLAVSGAQAPDYLADAMARAAAQLKGQAAEQAT